MLLNKVWMKELELEMHQEFEVRKIQEEMARQLRLKELGLQHSSFHSSPQSNDFDVNKCMRLIPLFNDKDIEKYFI